MLPLLMLVLSFLQHLVGRLFYPTPKPRHSPSGLACRLLERVLPGVSWLPSW